MNGRGMSEADWEALAMDTLGELAWETAEGKTSLPGPGNAGHGTN